MKKVIFGFLCLMLLSLTWSLSGCGHAVTKNFDREIVLAASRDLIPGPEDAFFASSIVKVWEPLVAVTNDGKAAPSLAESWESDESKKIWTFHLKKGVTFQDGTPFNAAAVYLNFERYRHMGVKPSSFYTFSLERFYPGLIGIDIIDDSTVRLRFRNPFPMLIYRMAGWGSAMFSPSCFDANTGEFTGTAIGTGPFRIVERVPDSYAVIERFDGYHGEPAKASRIRILTIPSVDTRYSAMRAGEIQGVLDLGGLTPRMASELEKTGDFRINAAHSTISHYLSVNGGRFPFQDERMRKAINMAIDRNKIAKFYFCGFATPTRSFLNSTNPFGRVVSPVYDSKEARRLVGEVLGNQRVEVKFLLPQDTSSRYPYKEITEFIQAELKDVGIDMRIVMADYLTSRKMMKAGDYDLSIGIRGIANLDPTLLLSDFFRTGGATNKASHFMYSNPKVDADFEALETTWSMDDRKKYYDDIINELLDHPAIVPLVEDENIAVCSKKLAGYDAAVYGITLDKVHWAGEEEK